jgi:integrase
MNPNQGDGEKALVLATGEGTGLKGIPSDVKGELIGFAWWLKKQGRSETTIQQYHRMLMYIFKRGADLNDPESVKEVLAKWTGGQAWKGLAIAAYSSFLLFKGKSWIPPKVNVVRKLPFIPLESEIDALIAGCGPKTSTLLQLLKETGMRVGEAFRLTWDSIDPQRRIIILNEPEKNGNPRIFKVSSKLIGMLNRFPKTGEKVFGASYKTVKHNFRVQRKRLAEKLNNPRLNKITFHTLRHWRATMEYHKTKDPLYVKEMLGHKKLDTTLLYIQVEKALFGDNNDEFTVKVTRDPNEARVLLETGFEYVFEMDGLRFFRKRK